MESFWKFLDDGLISFRQGSQRKVSRNPEADRWGCPVLDFLRPPSTLVAVRKKRADPCVSRCASSPMSMPSCPATSATPRLDIKDGSERADSTCAGFSCYAVIRRVSCGVVYGRNDGLRRSRDALDLRRA